MKVKCISRATSDGSFSFGGVYKVVKKFPTCVFCIDDDEDVSPLYNFEFKIVE